MNAIIKVEMLQCHIEASEKQKNAYGQRRFSLDKYPKSLQNEMESFVFHRGQTIAIKSIITEITAFNHLGAVLREYYPDMESFVGSDFKMIQSTIKKWLIKNGYSLTMIKKRPQGREGLCDAEVITYFRKVWNYYNFQYVFNSQSDIWYLDMAPMTLMQNRSKPIRTLDFSCIPLPKMREELKRIIYLELESLSTATLLYRIYTVRDFANYLMRVKTSVEGFNDITRGIFEGYLIEINTKKPSANRKIVSTLRMVFEMASRVFGYTHLAEIVHSYDRAKNKENIKEAYSESEIRTIFFNLHLLDPQVARVIKINMFLGIRISQVLSLPVDCIYENESGDKLIEVPPVKRGKVIIRQIDDAIAQTIKDAIYYSKKINPSTRYVFIADENPCEPMHYQKVSDAWRQWVYTYNLRDDHGRPFAVGTHTFRRTYGKTLADLGYDDLMIAQMLGHSSLSSVRSYRAIENRKISQATKKRRNEIASWMQEE